MNEPNNERQHFTDHTLGLPPAADSHPPSARESERSGLGIPHDPATCWWCLNPGPRRALEFMGGMEFSEKHG